MLPEQPIAKKYDMKAVKLSSKMMQLKFMPCQPWYIESRCHGSCCRSTVHKDGISVVIHPKEMDGLDFQGEEVVDGFLTAKNKRCPFQEDLGLCSLHKGDVNHGGYSNKKPFGCVTSPFTLNHNDTLIVRNRYKLLVCFKDARKFDVTSNCRGWDWREPLPAYVNFNPSLIRLFGLYAAHRITEHFDRQGDDITMVMHTDAYNMLKDNDNARKS